MMIMHVEWRGPFGFTSKSAHPVLTVPDGAAAGLYFWAVRASVGRLPFYVGETGLSFAVRHLEHFEAYASGVYNTRDAEALMRGEEVILSVGRLWRRQAPAVAQPFVDHFETFAHHIARTLDLIEIYLAPCECTQHMRRRLEGGLVTALYSAPSAARSLFPPGYRAYRRADSEEPVVVEYTNAPEVLGFPARFEA